MKTFYLYNAEGEEVEQINPVESFEETSIYWRVENGYCTYVYNRDPGYTYEIRTTEDEIRDSVTSVVSTITEEQMDRIIASLPTWVVNE